MLRRDAAAVLLPALRAGLRSAGRPVLSLYARTDARVRLPPADADLSVARHDIYPPPGSPYTARRRYSSPGSGSPYTSPSSPGNAPSLPPR